MIAAANQNHPQDLRNRLIKGLTQIPADLALTPLLGNKAPYRSGWQTEQPLTRDAIAAEVRSGRAKGYGIRTGQVSGGIVAVDLDGSSAAPKMMELSGGEGLPQTVAFTSGRPGRAQYLFRIPEQYWGAIQTKKIKTDTVGDDGKPEQLELRWNGCQSVLPPSAHPTTGQYYWVEGCAPGECEVAPAPLWLIELMLKEPVQPAIGTNYVSRSSSAGKSEWTNVDWALSYLESLHPSRADDYDQWLVVGMALRSINDSLLVEWDKWSQQSSKYRSGDCEKKWRSFSNSGISIGSLAHMAKQDGWRSPFKSEPLHSQQPSKGAGKNTSGSGSDNPPLSPISLRDRILEILNRGNLVPSERRQAYLELGKSTGYHLREIEQLADLLEAEADLVDGRGERAADLDSLIKVSERSLTLSKYLHPHLSKPLEQLATWMGVETGALLTLLLPVSASLLHPDTRVVVKECTDFVEPLIFYCGLVSESGNRKSPTMKVILKGLKRLQNSEEKRYKLALERHKEDYQDWRQAGANGEPPPEPKPPREFFVDNITAEALDRIKGAQPEHGLLIHKDELSGLIASYGAYKNGRGSDKEGILSGWNGDGIKVNRAGGTRISLSQDASSIVGGIQPDTLRKKMGDLNDSQGEWARFLWFHAELKAHRLPKGDTSFDVGNLLEGIYRKIDDLPAIQYRFAPDAQSYYEDWHWILEQRRVKEPRQGMRAAIAKMQGYTARLVGILHILWCVAEGRDPDSIIPLARVVAARRLAEFYLGQTQLIYRDGAADQGELTPVLSKILEKAQQLGNITTRTAKVSIFALRSFKADKILECFGELAAMGRGILKGKVFTPAKNVDPVDPNVDELLIQPKNAETVVNRSSQPQVGLNVDLVDQFSKKIKPTANIAKTDWEVELALDPWADTPVEDGSEVPPALSATDFVKVDQQHQQFTETLAKTGVAIVDQNVDPGSTIQNVDPERPSDETVIPQIGSNVRTPEGYLGVVTTAFPDGRLGVEFNESRQFAAWEVKELTIVDQHQQPDASTIPQQVSEPPVSVPQLAIGKRVRVGNFYGKLGAQTPAGLWLIDWDALSASQRRQYGEPPAGAIAASQIELIEVAT